MFANFQSVGTTPLSSDFENIKYKGFAIMSAHSFISTVLDVSHQDHKPCLLLTSLTF